MRALPRWYPFNAFPDTATWLAIGHADGSNAVQADPSLAELTAAPVDPDGIAVAGHRVPAGFTPGTVSMPGRCTSGWSLD